MAETNDLAGLAALVEDVGAGNVIDAELLEGCTVDAHELDEMGPEEAAQVEANCLATLLGHTVKTAEGSDADADEGRWSGRLDGFGFVISRDDLGDLVLDFSVPAS